MLLCVAPGPLAQQVFQNANAVQARSCELPTLDERPARHAERRYLVFGGSHEDVAAPCVQIAARRFREAVEEVVRIYDDWSEGVPLHPIHGDCHVGNLLMGDEGWFFLDFDDMVHGPAVHDVWMLLPGRDAEAARQRALLTAAYREFRPFDERTLRLVEPLRAFRFVFYAGWIAKRWEDPCFPDAFPHFGTEDYWANETRDLEQQVERILSRSGSDWAAAGELQTAVEPEEGELTNKDFFWDL